MADKNEELVLSIRGMSKSFGRNRVLDHIDLDVYCADNMRGSKEYREKLVEGLTQKLLRKVESYVG